MAPTRTRPSETSPSRRSGRTRLLFVLAVLLLLLAIAALVAHYRAPGRTSVIGASAFSPYVMIAAPIALLMLLVARYWLALPVALVVTGVCAATQLPLYLASSPPADARVLVTMTSNLRLGHADADDVVAAVRRHHVDVLMLEELTPTEQQLLIAAGLDTLLGHHVSDPRLYAAGTGLWSRYPLSDVSRRQDFTFAFVTARVTVPGLAGHPTLAALHMAGPDPDPTDWHHDITHLRSVLPALAASGPVVVGGDFNATPDMQQFRAVLTDGFADGANQAGAGMTRTYPSDRAFPPLIAIDHVLTRDAVGTSAETVEIAGSDHRALVVSVAVPRR